MSWQVAAFSLCVPADAFVILKVTELLQRPLCKSCTRYRLNNNTITAIINLLNVLLYIVSLDCDWIYSLWCFYRWCLAFLLNLRLSPSASWPYVHMVAEWWKSFLFSYSSLSEKMLVECLWAKTVTYGHSLSLSLSLSFSHSLSFCFSLVLSLSQICTHMHTTLGQQHRWVLGKQAAAGGGKDHKAARLAKFHHLLWIAWDAHSASARGMSQSHMIHMQPAV